MRFVLLLIAVGALHAQNNTPLTQEEFRHLVKSCAPHVAASTALAIARTESALHPYAVSLNYPHQEARRRGFSKGYLEISRQPRSKAQAQRWTAWMLAHGYTVSIGLMQINTEQANRLGLAILDLFDPCTNLYASSRILRKVYTQQRQRPDSLNRSLDIYNGSSAGTLPNQATPYSDAVRKLATSN